MVAVKYRGVHIHGAHADTLACVIFLRLLERPEVAPHLADLLRGLAASSDPANRAAVEQVEAALAEMRDARARLAAHRDELKGCASATPQPVDAEAPATSVSSRPPRVLLVGEVAERLRCSETWVKRLCSSGVLSATKPGGRDWAIDAGSVAAYEAARRPVA